MDNEIVSIITPVFNEIEYINETAYSVINQSSDRWEWIIVDDGSSDGSFEICSTISKSDARIRLFKRPNNKTKGASSCRNYGIIHSRGSYLMFLDADDLLIKNCIESRLEKATEHFFDLLIFKMAYLRGKDASKIVNDFKWERDPIRGFLRYELPWPITAVLWKRAAISQLLFDENLPRLEDPDLHLRALLAGMSFGIVPEREIDCLYRVSKEDRVYDKMFIIVVAESFLAFFEKWCFPVAKMSSNSRKSYRFFVIEVFKRINKVEDTDIRRSLLSTFLKKLKQYCFLKQWEILIVGKIIYLEKSFPNRKLIDWILLLLLKQLKNTRYSRQ